MTSKESCHNFYKGSCLQTGTVETCQGIKECCAFPELYQPRKSIGYDPVQRVVALLSEFVDIQAVTSVSELSRLSARRMVDEAMDRVNIPGLGTDGEPRA